jgi:hypothetical protein
MAMNKMQPELVHITPSLAASWLKFNEGNRRLPVGNSKYYARLIEAGEFQLTHQALAFSGTKANPIRLLDGQTRLTAVIETGIPIWQWVFWNTPDSTFSVLDGGKQRTFSDHHGWDKSKIAFVNVMHWMGPGGMTKITKTEADSIYDAFGGYYEMLMAECPTAKKQIACSSVRAATVLAMHQNHTESPMIAAAYRDMVLEKFESMPPSVRQLYAKLKSVIGGGREAIMVQFPFTHKAMTPSNFSVSRLVGYPTRDKEKKTDPQRTTIDQYLSRVSAYIKSSANL